MSHGRYSRVTRTALERILANYVHTHGPPSERTRSQIHSRNVSSTPTPNPALTTPSAGDLTRTRNVTRTLQRVAEQRLRSRRIRLRRYIASESSHDEFDDLGLSMPTQWLIEQLGTRDGDIEDLPRLPAATWDSGLQTLSRRARRRAHPSDLREVMVSHSTQELDDEFGVLPGEPWGGGEEDDWEAEEAVLRGLTADGNVFEALMDGERPEWMWRSVISSAVRCVRDEDVVIISWMHAEQKRWSWRVMDPRCMRMVWKA